MFKIFLQRKYIMQMNQVIKTNSVFKLSTARE